MRASVSVDAFGSFSPSVAVPDYVHGNTLRGLIRLFYQRVPKPNNLYKVLCCSARHPPRLIRRADWFYHQGTEVSQVWARGNQSMRWIVSGNLSCHSQRERITRRGMDREGEWRRRWKATVRRRGCGTRAWPVRVCELWKTFCYLCV